MGMSDNKLLEVTKTLLEEVRKMPLNTSSSTGQLTSKLGLSIGEDDLAIIDSYLYDLALGNDIVLDKTAYDDMLVGLPQNIPFVKRMKINVNE